MKGIHCALVELRTSAAGKDWCRLSVGIGEGRGGHLGVGLGLEKARVLARLAKGVEVYVEGRLTMNTWEGKGRPAAHGAVGLGVARRGSGADWKELAGEGAEACGGVR